MEAVERVGQNTTYQSHGKHERGSEAARRSVWIHFVISRSGVRVRLPAPSFRFSAQVNMGEFPSGQRGQTVNLLSVTSVVRIHLPPPKSPISYGYRTFLHHFAVFAFLGKYALPYNQLPVVGPKVFVYLFWQFVSSRGSSPFDPHHDPHNEMRRNIQRAPERTTLSGALWALLFPT